jgi:hypothetical protein
MNSAGGYAPSALEHDGFKSNRRDAQLTSPRRGEVDAHRQMRGG